MSTSTQRKSTKTSIVSGGRNKVHTTFEDGEEMVLVVVLPQFGPSGMILNIACFCNFSG
jgi:hypothetical protein